ncbi:TlpA family protein disulfide reductase [Pokkaliibacter sp. CJK22405]|uniref:TlpA family protein disulfide reductase n=1 Tax=Pokkaliibacter sp. CJK22405 TaxID=3384615 RepID=UPI0039852214
MKKLLIALPLLLLSLLSPLVVWAQDLDEIKQQLLLDEQSQPVDWTEYQGKWLLVNFWATWCPPCVHELPALDKLDQSLGKERPFRVLAINLGDSRQQLDAFWEKMKWTPSMPIISDEENQLLTSLRLKGLPSSWLISPDGQVVETISGMKEWDSQETMDSLKARMDQH